MGEKTNVCYVGGCGRLGYPMAVWTAQHYETVIADVNGDAIDSILLGTYSSPEPHVNELAKDAHEAGNLNVTSDVMTAAERADLIFVITQTPSLPDGSFTERYVIEACREIGKGLALAGEAYQSDPSGFTWKTVCIASTVMPGRIEGPIRQALEEASGLTAHKGFGLCCTPEFVRQGAIIKDFSNPDFVVIGCETDREWETVKAYYHRITRDKASVFRMSIPSAEIAKMGLNVAVVAKVARANELALLCHFTPGADAADVLDAIGRDSRIGQEYFSAGTVPGGPCFPRDNKAMVVAMRERELEPFVTQGVNAHEDYLTKRMAWIIAAAAVATDARDIVLLGLTYKPGVDLMVGSPGLLIAQELANAPPSLNVYAYDPRASVEDSAIAYCFDNLDAAVLAADMLVLVTPHKEYLSLYDVNLMDKVVVDLWGFLEGVECKQYVRFGRGD